MQPAVLPYMHGRPHNPAAHPSCLLASSDVISSGLSPVRPQCTPPFRLFRPLPVVPHRRDSSSAAQHSQTVSPLGRRGRPFQDGLQSAYAAWWKRRAQKCVRGDARARWRRVTAASGCWLVPGGPLLHRFFGGTGTTRSCSPWQRGPGTCSVRSRARGRVHLDRGVGGVT